MHRKKTRVKEIEAKIRAQETMEKRLKFLSNSVGMFPPCYVR